MKKATGQQRKRYFPVSGPRGVGQGARGPSIFSFLVILCLVAACSALYLSLSHFVFPNFALLESHVATVIVDSLVATLVAFFVMRKIYRLSDERRVEKLRADTAESSIQSYARRLIETSLDPMVTISPDGIIKDANAAAEEATGLARQDLIGTDFSQYFTDPERARDVCRKVLEQGDVRDLELTIKHANGRFTPVLYNASVYSDGEGEVGGIFAAARDISRYRKAVEETERRNHELVAINSIGRTVSQSLELKEMLGAALHDLLRLPFFRGEAGGMIFLARKDSPYLSVTVHEGIKKDHPCLSSPIKVGECLCGLSYSSEDLIISHRKSADSRHTRVCHGIDGRADVCVPLRARHSVMGVLYLTLPEALEGLTDGWTDFLISIAAPIGIAIDNARLYEEVKLQNARLRNLSYRLGELEESERRALSRELHDRVGQNLTALAINLTILRTQLVGNTVDSVLARLDDCVNLVGETTERMRDIMVELRPAVLDDYGLLAALRWYGTKFSSRTGIEVRVEGEEKAVRLGTSIENALFRIAQEALTNVAKHAKASLVTIRFHGDDGYATMTIWDNGKGFAQDASAKGAETPSWGILTMRERAERVGGRFEIDSGNTRGTTVRVDIQR